MRVDLQVAVERGWVTKEWAADMRRQAAKEGRAASGHRGKYTSEVPQERLFMALQERFGDRVEWEFEHAVPGRKFRIDVAFPKEKVAVECDGFQFHRSLEAFKKDRARQNEFVLAGWRVLRYVPKDIFANLDDIVSQVAKALEA